ncbi:reverse transcriptase [Tanacetum coccineum]
MAEIVVEKNPSDGVETPNEEETRGRITQHKKDSAKRDKARSKSRPPKPLHDEGASGDNLEERVTTLEAYVIEIKEQMHSLREAVKMTTQENAEVIEATKVLVQNPGLDSKKEIEKMSQDLLSARKFVEDEIFTMHEKMDNAIKEWKNNQKKHNDESTSSNQGTPFSPLKVPKPDMYNSTRNATLVEKNLFGLEQYFEAMGVVEDVVRISNAPAFLREAAQLWWRRKHHEREKGIFILNTWDQFKAELRKQFVPHNADSEVKAKLR